MNAVGDPGADRAVESLLAFWAESGVDAMLLDSPVDRIAAGQAARLAPVTHLQPRPAPGAAHALAATETDEKIAEARALAAAAADIEALAAAIAAFDGCPLKFEGAAQRSVFYRGSPTAPVFVIGEGPGADEDAQGQPFVGRAGKLLDRMLSAAGLLDRVFITNTVFWRPPGNRTPTPAEQKVCMPFVERAIELISPKIILMVGGASAKAMLRRDEGILSLRGRWFEWRAEGGDSEIPALPTLHPAFLLRQPAAKKRAWSDLLTLVERLDRPDRPV